MPSQPARPCRMPGCPALTRDRAGYCRAHADTHRRWGGVDTRRSAAARGYDSAWRTLRDAVLDEQPTCADCHQPATLVDHIVPLRFGGTHDRANLKAMCRRCHARKSEREKRMQVLT